MIEWLMVFGVGLMAGCLLMLLFIPLVHRRAVENTKRDLTETEPLTASAIQAERDQLRAQFAMAVRRLEIGVEDMRAKALERAADRQHADISRLQVELDKRTAVIFALRAREEVRKGTLRRIVKLLLYLFVRSKRRCAAAPPLFEVRQGLVWEFDRGGDASELASTAAAIAAVNLKRRQAVSNKH
jgi:hypothetical protein